MTTGTYERAYEPAHYEKIVTKWKKERVYCAECDHYHYEKTPIKWKRGKYVKGKYTIRGPLMMPTFLDPKLIDLASRETPLCAGLIPMKPTIWQRFKGIIGFIRGRIKYQKEANDWDDGYDDE